MPFLTVAVETELLKYLQQNKLKTAELVSQILTRQLLSYLPSKPSPQKTAVENTQKEPKQENAAFVDGGQQQHRIKQ